MFGTSNSRADRANALIGNLRTEYMSEDDAAFLFSLPGYWSELMAPRPTFLVGGRGTGKTTTLRALTYERRNSHPEYGEDQIIGAYWRCESNVTTSFKGPRLGQERWEQIFAHYLNLRLTEMVLNYATLEGLRTETNYRLHDDYAELFRESLGVAESNSNNSVSELLKTVRLNLVHVERKINGSTAKLEGLECSALGQPVRWLFKALPDNLLDAGKTFAFCLDEYENLMPYQQRLVNTLVKHAGDAPYTFKIGVRSTYEGERNTNRAGQPLHDPADYTTVDIDRSLQKTFPQFARSVCNLRIERAQIDGLDVEKLLPSVSQDEEAVLLGSEILRAKTRLRLVDEGAASDDLRFFDELQPLQALLLKYWSEKEASEFGATLQSMKKNPGEWSRRVTNHGYAALFTIRAGKRGIRKHYAGFGTYCLLADHNIRTLLRLVSEAISVQFEDDNDIRPVEVEEQTRAAQRIGHTMVGELQAQSREGARVMTFVQGLGGTFAQLARDPIGRTPEQNQFRVAKARTPVEEAQVDHLLKQAALAGGVVPFSRNKDAAGAGGTLTHDYRLATIFSAAFGYSHRLKRRLALSSKDVLELADGLHDRVVNRLVTGSGADAMTGSDPDEYSEAGPLVPSPEVEGRLW